MISIANIVIHRGRPPQDNPYRGYGRIAGEPITAVTANSLDPKDRTGRPGVFDMISRGEDVSAFTFWLAPASGGAFEISSEEVRNCIEFTRKA